ncbi:hypothetical protein DCO60_04665 [Helicobacter saguini]|uniref:hypothetical protein n=1 Tax=Helicobacter saguini TaxID=1548018 RepID=UPI00132BA46E|nr:hypothetical protein [Helicobacter saguini]MWV61749.1 hypothetical protein [Helicobacter saguini]
MKKGQMISSKTPERLANIFIKKYDKYMAKTQRLNVEYAFISDDFLQVLYLEDSNLLQINFNAFDNVENEFEGEKKMKIFFFLWKQGLKEIAFKRNEFYLKRIKNEF